MRAKFVKELRRRHVNVNLIRRVVKRDGQIGITFYAPNDRRVIHEGGRVCRRRRPSLSLSALRWRATQLERMVVRTRKEIAKKGLVKAKKELAKAKQVARKGLAKAKQRKAKPIARKGRKKG
jgi:hypothetical protein